MQYRSTLILSIGIAITACTAPPSQAETVAASVDGKAQQVPVNSVAQYTKEAEVSKDPEGVWIRACGDQNEAVKQEAARCLARIGTERSLPVLNKLLQEPPKIRDHCGPIYDYVSGANYAIDRIETDIAWAQLLRDYPPAARDKRAIQLLAEHPKSTHLRDKVTQLLIDSGSPEAVDSLLAMTFYYNQRIAAALAKEAPAHPLIPRTMLERLRLLDQPVPDDRDACFERHLLVKSALMFFKEVADVRNVPELFRAFDVCDPLDRDVSLMTTARDAVISCGAKALPMVYDFYGQKQSIAARHNAIIVIALIGGDESIRILGEILKKEQAYPQDEDLTRDVKAHIERLTKRE